MHKITKGDTLRYIKISAAIYLFMFSFTYSLFIIFHLPISFFEEPNEITFIFALLLMIASFITLASVKSLIIEH